MQCSKAVPYSNRRLLHLTCAVVGVVMHVLEYGRPERFTLPDDLRPGAFLAELCKRPQYKLVRAANVASPV